MQRLGFYTPESYPVQAPDLLAYALQLMVAEILVGNEITPLQAPTLAAIRKNSTPLDVIKWRYNAGQKSVGMAEYTAPALYSQFPGVDNGVYVQGAELPLEITIGSRKLNNLIKVNGSELELAQAAGVSGVQDLFGNRLSLAVAGIIEAMNVHVFQGGLGAYTNSPINGLEHLFSTNEYAGLPHTLVSYTGAVEGVDYFLKWRPTSGLWTQADAIMEFNDGHGVVLATEYDIPVTSNGILSAFQFFSRYLNGHGKTYNAIICHPDVEFAYSKAYDMKTSIQLVNGQMSRAEAGFASPSFQGFPLISDRNCPVDKVYFIDSRKLQVLTKGAPQASIGSQPVPFQGLSMALGGLAVDTISTQRYELLTLPQLHIIDTTGVSRLTLNPVDIYSEEVQPVVP